MYLSIKNGNKGLNLTKEGLNTNCRDEFLLNPADAYILFILKNRTAEWLTTKQISFQS